MQFDHDDWRCVGLTPRANVHHLSAGRAPAFFLPPVILRPPQDEGSPLSATRGTKACFARRNLAVTPVTSQQRDFARIHISLEDFTLYHDRASVRLVWLPAARAAQERPQ